MWNRSSLTVIEAVADGTEEAEVEDLLPTTAIAVGDGVGFKGAIQCGEVTTPIGNNISVMRM